MSDDKKNLTFSLSFMEIFIFLIFCNVYQHNATIAELTLTTIFMALLWSALIIIAIGLIIGILLLAAS